jgi:hypothetical protein
MSSAVFMITDDLNFLTTEPEILKALLQSKQEGTAIGIRAPLLGPETIITAVDDIIFTEENTLIILKSYDSTGYMLPSHKVELPQIQAVYPFATPFTNPFLQNLEKDKTWFF